MLSPFLNQATSVSRARTKGERLFEDYLYSQGITHFEYEKHREGKVKRIDYTVSIGREYLFDVKDFTRVVTPPYDKYKRLRERIGKLRKQFHEYKEWPCCGVLYNDEADVYLSTPEVVLGAMYGNLERSIRFNTSTGEVVSKQTYYLSGGKMLFRSIRTNAPDVRNTTISALITLRYVRTGFARMRRDFRDKKQRLKMSFAQALSSERDFDSEEEHLAVIVWENGLARIEFPRGLFCGNYDARYGIDDGGNVRRLYVGDGLLEYEALLGEDPLEPSYGRLEVDSLLSSSLH